MNDLLKYIEKYNLEFKITQNFNIDIVMCLLAVLSIIFFIRFIIDIKKQNKVNSFSGRVSGTFVSVEAYDSTKNKNIKKTLIRYTVNDKAIIKRMIVPKQQLKEETLNIAYNVNNPNEAILIGDKTFNQKAIVNIIISIIFIGLLIGYYIMFK